MRPIPIAAATLGAVVAVFLVWRAVVFFPGALSRFENRPLPAKVATAIDSSLFEQETAGFAQLDASRRDTSLDATLSRLRDSLGVFRSRISAVHMDGGDVPLYSMEFRNGVPLVARVSAISSILGSRGYLFGESSERPRAIWPWAMRVQRGDTLVALLRGRISGDPAPGSFVLHLGFVETEGSRIPPLKGLPRGTLVALPPEVFADPGLGAMLRAGGWEPALEVRLETSRDPVSLQKSRILLQHLRSDLQERLLPVDSCRTVPRGLVVADGDRGSSDPELSRRVVDFAKERGWWLLDATGNPASRLSEQAIAAGLGTLDSPRSQTESLSAVLAAAQEQAIAEGESSLLLPLDSITVRRVVAYLPLLGRRGVVVAPWPVLHRKARRD
jgi:hypothetical protein